MNFKTESKINQKGMLTERRSTPSGAKEGTALVKF